MFQNNHIKEKSQLLHSLLTQGKRKGYIKAETIKSRFDRYNLSDEEFDAVINKFADEDIEVIIDGEEPDDMCSDLDIDIQIPPAEDTHSADVDTLKTYINEVHRFPTLTKNEIKTLIRRISEGDATARDYLINCNLKFALSIAMKYAHNGLPILDLIQQANIGVIVATDRFNPNMGTTFSSYCVFWIKRYIINFINEHTHLIHIPHHINLEINRINKAKNDFYLEYMRFPTDNEIADITGLSIAKVKSLQTNNFTCLSSDSKPNDEMDGTFMDLLSTDENVDDELHIQERDAQINIFLSKLSEREQRVLILHFGLQGSEVYSLEEIGKEIGLTRERVRQIESKAIRKLRAMKDITNLHDYIHL